MHPQHAARTAHAHEHVAQRRQTAPLGKNTCRLDQGFVPAGLLARVVRDLSFDDHLLSGECGRPPRQPGIDRRQLGPGQPEAGRDQGQRNDQRPHHHREGGRREGAGDAQGSGLRPSGQEHDAGEQ